MIKVKDKKELKQIILDCKIPLETIDTSEITDMSCIKRRTWTVFSELLGHFS